MIFAMATSAFDLVRQPMTTVAPISASEHAVSKPMPQLAPVTTTTLPDITTANRCGGSVGG